MTRTFNKH